jgi:hypothetical protein
MEISMVNNTFKLQNCISSITAVCNDNGSSQAVAAFFRSIRKFENFDELSLVGLICVTATMPLANINI